MNEVNQDNRYPEPHLDALDSGSDEMRDLMTFAGMVDFPVMFFRKHQTSCIIYRNPIILASN